MNVCVHCGRELVQKRFSSGVLESPSMLVRRKFCNRICMAQHMKKEICGMTNDLQVHHVDKNPRNNVPSNLRTLCRSCHARCHSPNFTETGELRNPCVYCNKPSMKRGLCYTHLSRFKRFGHPLAKKKKTASGWVLMLHDGKNWFHLPSNVGLPTAWDDCAVMVTPSTRGKRKSS